MEMIVIARSEATKQSMAPHMRMDGLLRSARNDGSCEMELIR